jgi:hypothetical protein
MTIWVDAQLSPRTAHWIAANFPVAAFPLRDIGLRDASDESIFEARVPPMQLYSQRIATSFEYWSSEAVLRRCFGSPVATLLTPRSGRFFRIIFRPRLVCSPGAKISSRSVLRSERYTSRPRASSPSCVTCDRGRRERPGGTHRDARMRALTSSHAVALSGFSR